MFFADYEPPHFHADYAEHKAVIDIRSIRIREGYLPRRAAELVLDWTELHQHDLLKDWELCRSQKPPDSIDPLR